MQITVACPNCNYQLHLPGPEYLGRRGKCPACEHKFVMEKMQAAPAPKPEPEAAEKPAPKPKLQPETKSKPKPASSSGKARSDSPRPAAVPSDVHKLKDRGSAPGKNAAAPQETPIPIEEGAGDDLAPVPDDVWEAIDSPPAVIDSRSGADMQRAGFDVMARCPHCHRGVDFRRDDELQDFPCPHCGQRFCLIHPESPPEALAMPKQVGIFPLHNKIAVGPFGSLYRAKDGPSQGAVVVKVGRGDQVDDAEREAFLATLRSVMQLKHGNIATLHEVDCAEGRVYLVSSYVSGIDLADYLTVSPDRQLSIREVASTCALIASVLHHGHKFGVIHGNLKPTNIRLDGDLKPYLFDFGLAHRERAVQTTGDGGIVGSAAYLAPEQLPGNRRDLDPLTDVYAMGVIFYELLTGRRPFAGQGPELLKQIAKGNPPGPRSVKSTVPKALDTICMKCLELDPRDRYQSAMDVYKELRLFLEDKPIHTRPPGIFTRFGRWCRRRPIAAGLLITFLLLAAAGAGFVGWRIWQDGGFS